MTDALPDLPGLAGLPELPSIGPVSRQPPPGGARRHWQQATVLEKRPETARLTALRLKHADPAVHTPGQHLVVRLTAPDGYAASRSYSIASAPTDGTGVELLVERLDDGEVSGYLHDDLQVGDPLEVRGPFGGWFVWAGQRPALLIGGGSGLAPLVAMLRFHRLHPELAPVHLVASVRTPDDLPYAAELATESTIVYTRRAPTAAPRPAGRINAATLAPLVLPGTTAYICGSTGFADHVSDLLVGLGHPEGDIRVERYGATS